jgi:hypothetical protein
VSDYRMTDAWRDSSENVIVDDIPIPSNTGYQAYANPISAAPSEIQTAVVTQNTYGGWSNPGSYTTASPVAPLSYTPGQAAGFPMATVISEPTKGTVLNEDDQIKEAMKLSLIEYAPKSSAPTSNAVISSNSFTGLSKEDEEIARAIEQSIAAANPKTEDEPSNPHQRKREPGLGVGLKNIGNTCYVNSLLQTYFSIPELRGAIMKWDYTPWMSNPAAAEGSGGGVALVAALQELFAEMMLSDRK